MSAVQTFDFNQTPVRVLDKAGQPWFVAADVCRVLDIANSRSAVEGLDEDEKGVGNSDTLGGAQKVQIISESGLYALIFKSRKKEARVFRKWVTGQVLPAIRRTGFFAVMEGGGRVQAVLERAIGDLYEGRLTVEKAKALAALIGQYHRHGSKLGAEATSALALEEIGEEQREFAALISQMWRRGGADEEWSSLQMRELALAEGVFSAWLTRKNLQSHAVASKFGKLCDRQCNRIFGDVIFRRHGRNRGRHFTLSALPGGVMSPANEDA